MQVMSGTAMVSPASANTGSNGEAQTTVTFGGTAGTIIIQAVSTGLTGSPLSYSATAMALPTAITVQVVVWLLALLGLAVGVGRAWRLAASSC